MLTYGHKNLKKNIYNALPIVFTPVLYKYVMLSFIFFFNHECTDYKVFAKKKAFLVKVWQKNSAKILEIMYAPFNRIHKKFEEESWIWMEKCDFLMKVTLHTIMTRVFLFHKMRLTFQQLLPHEM